MEVTESEAIRSSVALLEGTRRTPAAAREGARAATEIGRTETVGANLEIDAHVAAQVAFALNEFANAVNVRIAFLVDQATGRTVIKVIDQETEEVIRQVPPEEMLRLVARMNQVLGVLLNHQA